MELVSVLERAAGVDLAVADRAAVSAMVADLACLSAWIEARRVAAVRRLQQLPDVQFPEIVVSDATREPVRDAQRSVHRAATLQVCPRFAKALAAGEITPAHVDAMTNALADISEEQRPEFAVHYDRLLDAARTVSAESFARTVRDTVRLVLSREDATARLRRQQRATRLSLWTHKPTGMVHLRGTFDPETGAELVTCLERARKDLYPDTTDLPDTCPTDPGARDDHLRAHALAHLVCRGGHGGQPGSGGRSWRPEVLLVTDERTLDHGYHERSIVDIGIDADVPHEAVQRLAATARPVRVTMRDGVVTSVDGRRNLDRGRTSRLADLDQRRALRAMYPCCAIPDCPVRFRDCRIHHITAWDNGGSTDLSNLLPVCSRHHHAIHDHGWTVTLDDARTLTVTHPDGTNTITPPPYAFDR